jgi:hypothetical protein
MLLARPVARPLARHLARPLARAPLFSPLSLPGLAAWYDASDSSTVLTQVGGATNFVAASSQGLQRTGNTDLSATGSFTITAWAKTTDTGVNRQIVAKWNGGGNLEYALQRHSTNAFRFSITPDGSSLTSVSQATVAAGVWYFVVAEYDATAGEIRISVNNAAFSSASFSSTPYVNAAQNFSVGRDGFTNWWNGDLDEITFHKRVLTADERTFLYNGGAGRTYAEAPDSLKTNLVSWWSMNAPATGNWLDQHGSNHLTPSASRPTATTGVTFNVAQNGQTVRRWLDKSGNGRHLNQTDLVLQPEFSSGGVSGNGTKSMVATFLVVEPQTHYFVAVDNSSPDNVRIFDGGVTGNRFMFRKTGGVVGAFNFGNAASVAGAINIRFVGGAVFTSAGGVFNGLAFSPATLGGDFANSGGLTILNNTSVNNGFSGTVFERLSYEAAHDGATRERVIRWLARKWGITL